MKRARGRKRAEPSPGGSETPGARPGQLKIQFNLILGERVVEMPPLELPAEALTALRNLVQTPPGQPAAPINSNRFALQRGHRVWQLTYAGQTASFAHRNGMDFVAYFLKHPHEPIHPLTLLAKTQGQAPVQQRSAALDDAEATREYLREMDRLRAAIESDETCDAEKKVAEEELAQLEQCGACVHHRTFDNASRAAKSVRQAIRRLVCSLAEARDEQRRPHAVLTAFAAHLEEYLLGPSQSGSAPTGYLVYKPPPGRRLGLTAPVTRTVLPASAVEAAASAFEALYPAKTVAFGQWHDATGPANSERRHYEEDTHRQDEQARREEALGPVPVVDRSAP